MPPEPARRLAIFDIDGTLTDTNAIDDECFLVAVAEVLRLDPSILDWSDAPHITDASLLSWLCDRHCGRSVRGEEVSATLRRFVELLAHHRQRDPERFRAIRGADHALRELPGHGWSVAIATGGWGASARIKLQAIGIDPVKLPLACADDAATRAQIVRLAIDRAEHAHGCFDRVVSIGDGPWDVRTARELELPFLGVGTGERAARLHSAGAPLVLPDLGDIDHLLAALDAAAVPLATTARRHAGP